MVQQVLVGDDGHGARTLTLARPHRLNAITMDMITQLEAALGAAMTDTAVRVIVLRGEGRAFCAGDDVDEQAGICAAGEESLRAQLSILQSISAHLMFGPKLSICAVQGWAIGAGMSWALNCDWAIWGKTAIGFFPEVTLGTHTTGGASALLPLIVGSRLGREMLFRGKRIGADEALANNIASQIVADDALDEATSSLASELASLPPDAAVRMKQALAAVHATVLRDVLAQEVEACVATTLNAATIARMRATTHVT
ncbi:MAG: hypothetical protein RLZZ366_790 [Pseudomonadota bacterium]